MDIIKNGDVVYIIIPLKNNSQVTGTNVEVAVTIPNGTTYHSHVLSTGSFDPATKIWSVNTVTPTDKFLMKLGLTIDDVSLLPLTVSWSVTSDQTDTYSPNDQWSEEINGLTCQGIEDCICDYTLGIDGTNVVLYCDGNPVSSVDICSITCVTAVASTSVADKIQNVTTGVATPIDHTTGIITNALCEPDVISVSAEVNATVVNNLDGTFTVTTTADGNYSFVVTSTCSDGTTTDSGTISGVSSTDPTITVDDATGVNGLTGTVFTHNHNPDITANASCSSGTGLTYTVSNISNATVTNNNDGTFGVTIAADGGYSFDVTATCSDGTTNDTGTVSGTGSTTQTITVDDRGGMNLTTGSANAVNHDSEITANATCEAAPGLTYVISNEVNATVVNNNDGTVSVTPTADGAFSYDLTVTCQDGTTNDIGTMSGIGSTDPSITVDDRNDLTGTTGVSSSVDHDSEITANATCEGGAGLTYAISNETNVTVTNNGDGTVTVTPTAAGAYSYDLTVTCGDGTTNDTGTMSGVAIDPPSVIADDRTNENGTTGTQFTVDATSSITANTTCQSGTGLTYSVSNENNATVVNNNDGTFGITITADGVYDFDYTVTCSDGTTNDTGNISGAGNTVRTVTVDDRAGMNLTTGSSNSVDHDPEITTNANCEAAPGLTYAISNLVNCTVANNNDGTVGVTPTIDGAFSYDLTVTCGDGATSDTGTMSGNGTTDQAITAADLTLDVETGVATDAAPTITPNVTCQAGAGVTYAVSNMVNCTVVNNNDGTFTVTAIADGAYSFDYTATCVDGTTSDTGTVSGTATTSPDITVDDRGGLGGTRGVSQTIDHASEITANTPCSSGTGLTYAVSNQTGVTVVNNNDGTVGITPTVAGVYSYLLTVTCSDGTTNDSGTMSGTSIEPQTITTADLVMLVEAGTPTLASPTITPNTPCEAAPGVTYTTSNLVNCTVVNNNNGTFTVTATTDGNYSFDYTAICVDGTTSSTSTISGTATEAPSVVVGDQTVATTEPRVDIVINHNGDITTNAACEAAPGLTYTVSNEVNCIVVNHNDGTFTVTPQADGPWSFDITVTCGDGTTFDTGTVSGEAITQTITVGDATPDIPVMETTTYDHNSEITANTPCEAGAGVTYAISNEVNCDASSNGDGTFDIYVSSAGVWSFDVTGTCVNGVAEDTGTISGDTGTVQSLVVGRSSFFAVPGTASTLEVLSAVADYSTACEPMTFTGFTNLVNCTITQSVSDELEVTPTATGAYSFDVTVACSGGTVSGVGTVSGYADPTNCGTAGSEVVVGHSGTALWSPPAGETMGYEAVFMFDLCPAACSASGRLTISNTVNCTVVETSSGGGISFDVTPTAAGAWSVDITMQCGTVEDTATLSGVAS